VENGAAAAVALVVEAHALGARDHDVAFVPPPELEERAQLTPEEPPALGPVEGRGHRLGMDGHALVGQSGEVLALLQRAVLDADQDVEHQVCEVALPFIGEAPLAVEGPHQARRGRRRNEPGLREAGSEALELEDERVALLLREERERLVGLGRVHGDENATSPDALGHHRDRGPGPHAPLGQQDSYLFRPDRPPMPHFASNREHLRPIADRDSRQRVAPQA
jgi:hypothetical protein